MSKANIDHAFTAKTATGYGSDPTYAGALSFMRRKFSKNLKGVDVAVMGVPFDCAVSNRPGCRFGPQAIRRASAILDNDPLYPFDQAIFNHLNVIDYGDCPINFRKPGSAARDIYREARKILKSNAKLLTLGGDHSITWSLLKAHCELYGPLALVQFDAHQDTWAAENSLVDHGSFVTLAVEQGLIDVDKSLQIGIRTHAPQTCGIEIIHSYDLEEFTPRQLSDKITEKVGSAKTYITFDIDCLDPAYAPGTGTPVAGGPSSSKMLSTLEKLNQVNMIGADVVEVAPAYDHADITAIAGAAVASHFVGLWAQRRGI